MTDWVVDPRAGFTDGPTLPTPPKALLETSAVISGRFNRRLEDDPSADEENVLDLLMRLLEINLEEALIRFDAWRDWDNLCWEVFATWCDVRGLLAVGVVWHLDGQPTQYADWHDQ